MKRYWSEICAALFLAVVINCFGGVIVYASSAEQQITDQMELTDLQSMVDEMLGEKTFSVAEAFHRLLSGEEVLSEESVREFLHSLLFYGIEREKELIVKLLLLLLLPKLLPLPSNSGTARKSRPYGRLFLWLLHGLSHSRDLRHDLPHQLQKTPQACRIIAGPGVNQMHR